MLREVARLETLAQRELDLAAVDGDVRRFGEGRIATARIERAGKLVAAQAGDRIEPEAWHLLEEDDYVRVTPVAIAATRGEAERETEAALEQTATDERHYVQRSREILTTARRAVRQETFSVELRPAPIAPTSRSTSARSRGRAPGRRRRTTRTSRGSPGRSDPDEPDDLDADASSGPEGAS
jgi:hypothetical protein